MTSPSVSVIIPTYNGAAKILNILAALETQTFSAFEVIVVIDGSTDNTYSLLTDSTFALDLKVINRSNGGRSVARNTGTKESQGHLIIFFDDDMRPLPDCIEKHLSHHHYYKNSICVGLAIDDENLLSSDFQKFRSYLTNIWNQHLPDEGVAMNEKNLLLAAANCSMPISIFQQLGGFDERLTDAEDFELGTRAIAQAIPVYFNIQAKAFHDDPVTCYTYIRRQREYAKAHEKLQQLKPHLVGIYSNAQVYKPSVLKKAVFGLFANKFFVYSIDRFNFYQFVLPQKIRYKLYDVVVWGMAKVFPQRQM